MNTVFRMYVIVAEENGDEFVFTGTDWSSTARNAHIYESSPTANRKSLLLAQEWTGMKRIRVALLECKVDL